MTTPLRIRFLCAFALSLISTLFIKVGNLRSAFSLMRAWFARWRRASLHPARARHASSGFRRFACMVMAAVMFLQVPASPQVSHAVVETVSAKAANSWESGRFWWHSSGWAARYERLRNEYLPNIGATPQKRGWDGKGAPRHSRPAHPAVETQQDREQRIARVKIFPGDVEIKTGEQVVFNAVAFDNDGDAVGGLDAKWSAFDEENNQPIMMSSAGTFVSGVPGRFIVTAEIAGHREQVRVTVSGEPRGPNLKSRSETPKSSRESRRGASLRAPIQGDHKQIARRNKQARTPALPGLRAASTPMAARPAVQFMGEDPTGWNRTNNATMDDIGKERGPLPGRIVDGGAGSGNFQFAAPVAGLDGRGIDLSLLLNYNSRVWHKAGSVMTFDIDRDWIAGWTLGFGKIVMAGDTYFLIDSDGARHPHNGTLRDDFPAPASALQSYEAYTTDGTFIDYYAEGYQPQFDNSGGRNMIMAWAVMPNGTRIEYGAPANYAMYPTRITDAHGNFISITYRNNQGPQIQTITDTLGRFIQFHYDGSGLLTAITVPGFSGGERVAVRLQYQWLTLSDAGANYGFAGGLTTKVRQNTIPVIRAIYYPGTSTGYWFGDGDSYSPYGMIRKVSEHRGMTFDDAPLDQQGNIGAGLMSRETVYNYPQSGGSYSDMPTYTQMTEDWAARHTTSAPATQYSVVDNPSSSTRTTTITRPDGAQIVQTTSTNETFGFAYGMTGETKILRDGVVLSRVKTDWEIEFGYVGYNSLRPWRTQTTDERGRTIVALYSYDQNHGSRYNAVTDVRVLGYSGELLRHAHTEYFNNSNYNGSLQNSGMLWWKEGGGLSGGPIWSGSHIFNLVSLSEVYAEDDVTLLLRAGYQYDGGSLINNPGMGRHNITYNQHAPEYDPATLYRGNLTQINRYADASTVIVETRTYDIAGNMRAQNTCCDQATFTYTTNTQYAWPDSQTGGSPSDPAQQNTSSATYNYNTGLATTSTDANGRVSQTEYDINTLRPIYEYSPTGAYQYHIYDDANLVVCDFVYEAGQSGGNFASRSDKYIDGLGRPHGEIAFGKDSVLDIVETKFDNIGRVWRQSRPFRYGVETPQWSEMTYDALDRPIQTISPDGSVVTRAYNQSPDPSGSSGLPGQTAKVTDSWGRERWVRSDALGRIVEVAEPNPGGNGSLSSAAMFTTYSYDAVGRLLQVNQGEQTRRFRHDLLGRLTHQKLAERDATLDDNGQWVGGGQWSDVFFYDTRSNVILKVDARGVKTSFNYNDPLNRLLAVNYDKNGSPAHLRANIPDAPNVTYGYMTSGDKMRAENVFVDYGMGNQNLSYDSEGRLSQIYQTFTGREAYPMVTNYLWDSLDRPKESTYPQQYGAGEIRKKVEPAYDIASRIESLKFGGVTYASNMVYNASSQMTSLNAGSQIAESYGYDSKTGLMTNQQVRRGAELLVDLKYNYTLNNDPLNNGPKTGLLTSLTDLKNQARNRAYEYDKLGRIIKAKGGPNAVSGPDWEQIYDYDRYGNKRITGSGGGSGPITEVWFDDALPAGASFSSYVAPSATIALRSINGYYVVAEQGPVPARVAADRSAIGPLETFKLIDINKGSLESGDKIQLRTSDGNRDIYATGGGEPYPGGSLYNFWNDTVASAIPPVAWAQFTIRKADGSPGIIDNDTDVSLQSTNGYYVVAEGGGAPQGSPPPAGRMYANRNGVGAWETFRLIVVSGSTIDGSDEAWEWTTSSPAPIPYSGAISHQSNIDAGYHQHFFWGATQPLQAGVGDQLYTYAYLDPANPPSEVMLQWNDGNWDHRAYWGADIIQLGEDGTASRRYMGPLPATGGWVRLEVPASAVGLEGSAINGMAFTLYGGRVSWDKAGKANGAADTVWVDDSLPAGASIGYDGGDNWTWLGGSPTPYSGAQSHRSKGRPGLHQHYFWGATQTLQVNAGDKLFAYVYLDPNKMPSEIMLQWNENGSWEHRAYWGANNIGWGVDGTESRRYRGPLPQAGGWVKLEVPASVVGLEGKTLNGMAFTLLDGQAWWDKPGKSNESTGGPPNLVMGRDGFDNLTYNATNNRITSLGFAYDPAGNQTRAVIDNNGTQQQYLYDCANRLAQVLDAGGNALATYAYGASNHRLMSVEGGVARYFAWAGGQIIAEYEASGANALVWKTSYVYLDGQLLATTSGIDGTETRFHHSDRLGTRLTTAADGTVVTEQWTMPFGNMQPFTSIPGGENPYQHPTLSNPSKKRFTTYDRSAATGLDYAQNRYYSSAQGRFTQVDPIGMGATSLTNPQSLNLYAYCENDPINDSDPTGLDSNFIYGSSISYRPYTPTSSTSSGMGWGSFFLGLLGLAGVGAAMYQQSVLTFRNYSPSYKAFQGQGGDESLKEKWDRFIRLLMWEFGIPATPEGDGDRDMEVMMGNKYGNTGATIGDFVHGEAIPALMEVSEILETYIEIFDRTGVIAPLMQFGMGREQADGLFLAMATNQGFGTFKSLKKAIGPNKAGHVYHHIVGQHKDNVRRFGAKAIHSTGNVIELPHGKGSIHQQISDYYNSVQAFTGGKRVRDWLKPQSYREQYRFGIKVLRQFGWKQRP